MSRILTRSFLQGDLAAARSLLARLGTDDLHLLDRMGLESRINDIKVELDDLERRTDERNGAGEEGAGGETAAQIALAYVESVEGKRTGEMLDARALRSFLEADLAAASALLARIPTDDAHLLDRIGLESRIRDIKAELERIPSKTESPPHVDTAVNCK